jgi:hypothetical protein
LVQLNQPTAYKKQHQQDGEHKSNKWRRYKNKSVVLGIYPQPAQQRHRQKE